MSYYENYIGNSKSDFFVTLQNIQENLKKSFDDKIVFINDRNSSKIGYTYCNEHYCIDLNCIDVYHNYELVASIEARLDEFACFYDIDVDYFTTHKPKVHF